MLEEIKNKNEGLNVQIRRAEEIIYIDQEEG